MEKKEKKKLSSKASEMTFRTLFGKVVCPTLDDDIEQKIIKNKQSPRAGFEPAIHEGTRLLDQ